MKFRSRIWLSSTSALGVSVALVAASATPALAAAPSIVVNLTQIDGTGPFTSADGPGDDSSATNGIVRVNDNLTYSVEVATNENSATNTSFSLQLPQGQEITALPAFCASGSSITPATLPRPTVPLTSTSYASLPQQTVTCVVGSRDANSTRTYPLSVKVRSEVPNGQVMGPVTATATAAEVVSPARSNEVSATASAMARYDVSKNGVGPTSNTGEVQGPFATPCPQDTSKTCATYYYPLTIAATTAGGKGTSPATSPITLTDALDPATLFPSLTAAQLAAVSADPQKYGATLECNTTRGFTSIPNSSGGGDSGVRDSGIVTCAQPGGPGTPANISFANTDTSLATYPTRTVDSSSIPANQALMISRVIAVNIPRALIDDFGSTVNGTKRLDYINTFTNFRATGIDGTVQTSTGQPAFNDFRSGSFAVATASGVGVAKRFAGEPGNSRNTGKAGTGSYIGGGVLSGPPGGWSYGSGQIQVGGEQTVTSVLSLQGTRATSPANQSALMCDVWDPSKLQLQSKSYSSDTQVLQAIAAGRNTPVWLSGFYNGQRWTTQDQVATTPLPEHTVRYSSGAFGPGASTDCAEGTWYDDPASVPGNDPTLAAQGIFTAVNKVRVWSALPAPTSGTERMSVGYSIGLRVAPGLPTGTILPNYAGYLASPDETRSEQAMLNQGGNWTTSTYNAGTAITNGNTGALGDRLVSSPNYARLTKLVKGPGQADFGTTPPGTTAGDTVQYQLNTSLNSAAPGTTARPNLTIEDCLPAGQTFVSSSLAPQVISVGSTPADATVAACATGQTYIRWDLGSRAVNVVIEPVILSVRVGNNLRSGTYTNTAAVTADGDLSSQALRSGTAQITVDNPSGIALDKVALTPQIQINRPGQATNEQASWLLTLTNNNSQNALTNPDVIDVLPKQGERGTAYDGTLSFSSAEVRAGGASLQYTSAPSVVDDADDPSNSPTGSTTWCTRPAGGTIVSGNGLCPTSAENVTGVRAVRPGAFASGESIQVQINMTATGDSAGDVFVNSASARVDGQTLLVGPSSAAVDVIASEIGDFVWRDEPRSGLQDTASVGVPGFPVSLTGTDDLGNPVSASTATDDTGKYSFPGLRAGTYAVTFEPDGLQGRERFSPQGVGTDRVIDSDGDTTTGATRAITLSANTVDSDVDQGILAPRGRLELAKSVDPASGTAVQPGQVLTYTLGFTNTGADAVDVDHEDVLVDILDDADMTSPPVSSNPSLSVAGIENGRIRIAGEVAPNQTVTVSYSFTVKADAQRGNDSLANYLVPRGDTPEAGCVPAEGETPTCTANPVSSVTVVKSSNPASESVVNPGDGITYTLTFTNVSSNPGAPDVDVDYSDYMADVLDDADLTAGPTVSSADLTAAVAGQTIRIKGALASGAKVTVDYTVTVKAYASQGDHALLNIVAATGKSPVCVDGSQLCTTHQVPAPPSPATPTDPVKPGPPVASPTSATPVLAFTGSSVLLLLLAGVAAVSLGTVVRVSRRRKKVS